MNSNLTRDSMNRVQQKFVEDTKSLRKLLEATEKTVIVEVAEADLRSLKASGYALCFAKKIGDFDYNVIWKSILKFLSKNKFTWQPIYKLFGTNEFRDQVKVEASTNVVKIGLGEITILDGTGILSNPVTGGGIDSLNVDNEYGEIHFAVSQTSINESGEEESAPIFVSKQSSMIGTATFKPVEKVQIWFQANAETSTMFSELRSNPMEVDLTDRNEVKIRYEDGKWSVV